MAAWACCPVRVRGWRVSQARRGEAGRAATQPPMHSACLIPEAPPDLSLDHPPLGSSSLLFRNHTHTSYPSLYYFSVLTTFSALLT
jgi:hypothetical protein